VPRQRAAAGSAHPLVDVRVEHAVECVGATGGQNATDDGCGDEAQRRDTACRQEHHRDRGQQQQLDDAWLGQRHVGTEDVAARDPPGGIGGHCQVELGVGRHGHLLVIAGDGLRGSLVMDWAPGSAPSGGRLLGRGASA
jgi:hypothetical protein